MQELVLKTHEKRGALGTDKAASVWGRMAVKQENYMADLSQKKKEPKSEKGYTPITREKYYKMFRGNGRTQDINKLENAHKLAWETRNFEIDKFWIRTAFFGGFTALIFNGYISILSGPRPMLIKNLDIYLICLGIIFSAAWFLSILGSKHWQENWEAHIDMLEDEITGPLYKIICCKRQWQCFSVSKINRFLAAVIILIWTGLLVLSIIKAKSDSEINCVKIVEIGLAVIAVIWAMVIICRSSGNWEIRKSMLKSRKKEFESGDLTYFIDRRELKRNKRKGAR
jgi:hypothetical protein